MKMTRWHKLCSLSFAELWLLIEAAAAVVAFDLALRLFSAKTCLTTLGGNANPHSSGHGVDRQRIAWLVEVADRYAPGRSSCLRQAAALEWLLRRQGIATNLRIGVALEGGNLMAHSWLESEEGELLGLSDRDKYVRLFSQNIPEQLQTGSGR